MKINDKIYIYIYICPASFEALNNFQMGTQDSGLKPLY